MIQCQACNRIILDVTSDGGYKLRSRMVLFDAIQAYALCPSCKGKVPVPIQLVGDIPPMKKGAHIIKQDGLPKSK